MCQAPRPRHSSVPLDRRRAAAADVPAHPSFAQRVFTGTLIRRVDRTTYEHDAQGRLTRRTRRLLNGQRRT